MARKPKYMSLDVLSRTSEFKSLTIRQALFVQTYVQSLVDLGVADQFFATRVAYGTDGDENNRTLSYQIIKNPKVKAALRVWANFGKSKNDLLLEDVRADIAVSRPGSPARAKLREIEAKLIGVKPKGKSK